MSTPQTKSTPPSYSVHAPGTRSAAGKAKTPTAESAQKTSHSVDKSGAQADETAKFRNARKSVLKTDKNTPTEDFQNRPPSSVGKEKASNTRSPLPKSEKESVPGQSGKKSEPESAKSKAQSGSKVGQTTPQQSRLDFTSGSKLAAKSADKELVGRILASGDKEGARRSQGKISSHSEMLPASTRQSGKKPVTQPIDADELEDLLEDDSAKVQVTAQKSREASRKNTPYQGTSGNKGQREAVIAEEDEEEGNEATGTAREANAGGDNMEESKVERKEYSVYEDWRILELVEEKLEGGEGSKATIPRSLWVTAEDPLTGRRLLDGRRTAESMRDRYKRYIALLDDVAKKEIKEFCTKHTAEEAKRNHCLFKKVGGQKQFAGISTQLNYDPERISRKTPYGTKSKKSPEKVSKKKAEAKKGKLERDFEEEDDIEEENQFDVDLLQEDDLEDIEQVTQTQTRTKLIKVTGGAREPGRSILVTKDTETVLTGKNKPLGFSMTSTKTEQLKESKKRKAGDNAALMEVGRREMKQVKQNNDYEDQSLTLNRVFQSRRPQKNAPSFENIMIYVDLDQGFRQFVKQEVEEEEEEEDEVQMRLRLLAVKYRLELPLVADAFSKASCDFDDLEEFLQTGDERLLWTEEEDSDLLEDNKKAIKYLKLLKGNDRVQKRKEFLLATL